MELNLRKYFKWFASPVSVVKGSFKNALPVRKFLTFFLHILKELLKRDFSQNCEMAPGNARASFLPLHIMGSEWFNGGTIMFVIHVTEILQFQARDTESFFNFKHNAVFAIFIETQFNCLFGIRFESTASKINLWASENWVTSKWHWALHKSWSWAYIE